MYLLGRTFARNLGNYFAIYKATQHVWFSQMGSTDRITWWEIYPLDKLGNVICSGLSQFQRLCWICLTFFMNYILFSAFLGLCSDYQLMVHCSHNITYTILFVSLHKPRNLWIYKTRDFELKNHYVFDKHWLSFRTSWYLSTQHLNLSKMNIHHHHHKHQQA